MCVALVSAAVYLVAGFAAGMDFKSGALGVPTIIVLALLISLGFAAIGAYIDGYHHRPHSGLAYRTPLEVAATWQDHRDDLTPAA